MPDPTIGPDDAPTNPKEDEGSPFEFEKEPDEVAKKEKPYSQKDTGELTEEKMEELRENEGLPVEIQRVEFNEDVSKQLYLMYVDWEDRYWLDLFMFDKQLKTTAIENDETLDYNCPKMMFNSMGLTSYFSPILKDTTIDDCPNLELSCCTLNDYQELENIWEDQLKPNAEAGHFYLEYFVRTVLEHRDLYKITAEQLLEATSDPLCIGIANSIKDFDVTEELAEKTLLLLNKAKEYDMQVKQSINCLVCNHSNIK